MNDLIVYNLDVSGAAFSPAKADRPLLIHTNAVLPLEIALQSFETIAWRHTQVFQFNRSIQQEQFA